MGNGMGNQSSSPLFDPIAWCKATDLTDGSWNSFQCCEAPKAEYPQHMLDPSTPASTRALRPLGPDLPVSQSGHDELAGESCNVPEESSERNRSWATGGNGYDYGRIMAQARNVRLEHREAPIGSKPTNSPRLLKPIIGRNEDVLRNRSCRLIWNG